MLIVELTFLRLLTRAYVSDSEQAGEEPETEAAEDAGISGNGGVSGGREAAAAAIVVVLIVNCCCGFLGKILA